MRPRQQTARHRWPTLINTPQHSEGAWESCLARNGRHGQGKIPVERRRRAATRAKASGCAEERLQSMVRTSAKETLASVHRHHDRGHARPADPIGPTQAEHPA